MSMTPLIELYEANEKRVEDAKRKVKFYKNASFLSLGFACVGVALIGTKFSEELSSIGTISLIVGGMGALYSTMIKNAYQFAKEKRSEALDLFYQLLSPEEKQTVEKRKQEMDNLRAELSLPDLANPKLNHFLKRPKR